MPSNVFRPNLPLDPFSNQQSQWNLDSFAPSSSQAPSTVLVLGAPSHRDIAPLSVSPLLAHSLLILATHTPPPIQHSPDNGPSIVILHLPAPVAVHDAGSLRLLNVLQRAQRVAHAWFTTPRDRRPRIQQLAEEIPGGEFTLREQVELAPAVVTTPPPPRRQRLSPLSPSPPPSPSSSYTSLSSSSPSTRSVSQNRNQLKKKTKTKRVKSGMSKFGTLPPFSAILNFLPPGVPDKALLKHAILVTTIADTFLVSHHYPGSPPVPPLPAPPPSSYPVSPSGTDSTASLPTPPQSRSRSRSPKRLFSLLSPDGKDKDSKDKPPADVSTDNLALRPITRNRSRSRLRLTTFFGSSSSAGLLEGEGERMRVSSDLEVDTRGQIRSEKMRAHLVHILPYSASPAYFAPPPTGPPHGHARVPTPKRSQSLLALRTASAVPAPTYPPPTIQPRMHPPAPPPRGGSKTKLVQGIEQFLLSFAYPLALPSSISTPSSPASPSSSRPLTYSGSLRSRPGSTYSSGAAGGSSSTGGMGVGGRPQSTFSSYNPTPRSVSSPVAGGNARASGTEPGPTPTSVPYLVGAGVLGSIVPGAASGEGVTLGEMVLLGALDGAAAGGGEDSDNGGWPRAWIGSVHDVVVAGGAGEHGDDEVVVKRWKGKEKEVDQSLVRGYFDEAQIRAQMRMYVNAQPPVHVRQPQPQTQLTQTQAQAQAQALIQTPSRSPTDSEKTHARVHAQVQTQTPEIQARVPQGQDVHTQTVAAAGKDGEPEGKDGHGQRRASGVRRNEAGLPTPASSMSGGASGSESEEDLGEVRLGLGLGSVDLKGIPDGDGGDGNEHGHEHEGGGNDVSEAAPAPTTTTGRTAPKRSASLCVSSLFFWRNACANSNPSTNNKSRRESRWGLLARAESEAGSVLGAEGVGETRSEVAVAGVAGGADAGAGGSRWGRMLGKGCSGKGK